MIKIATAFLVTACLSATTSAQTLPSLVASCSSSDSEMQNLETFAVMKKDEGLP
jgi:hypothetical protein